MILLGMQLPKVITLKEKKSFFCTYKLWFFKALVLFP